MSQSGAYLKGAGSGIPIETITGNTGGAVGPDGTDNINIIGSGDITVTGNPGTNTLTISSTSITDITITGDTGGPLTGDAFTFTGGTTGLTFNGAGTTETLSGDLIVQNGGTGAITFTADGVLIGHGTSPITSTAAGTTGQVLTGVTGSAPTFQSPAASSISITGDTGGSLAGSSFTFAGGTTGLTFNGAGTTETLEITNLNLPATTASAGQVNINGNTVLQAIGGANIFVGGAGNFTLTGSDNTAVGSAALVRCTSGTNNTCVGIDSLNNMTTGTNNTAVGIESLSGLLTSGSYNTGIGYLAGEQFGSTDSSNIAIGHVGSTGQSNTIRIGTQGTGNAEQNVCFIAGIENSTVTGSVVLVSTAGQMGAVTSGTTGQVLTGITGGSPTFQSPAASSITLTGDSGGALAGNAFTITGGTTGLTFAGAGTTETLTGDLVVANGGTGTNTFTSHGVLLGNTTSAITATAAGTTGQVLTGVTGSAPTFQSPAASSISITGDSGGALTGAAFTFTGGTTGLTFSGAGSTETLGGDLVVSNGGTGRATLTNHGVLVGAGTTAITQLGVGTNGQVLIGSTGADPAFASLTSTAASITYTTGANTLNLDIANWVGLTSFTPAVTFGGGSTGITYSSRSGYYIRIGSFVFFMIQIALSSKGSSTGAALVTGLPVTSSAATVFTFQPAYQGLTFVGTPTAYTSGTSINLVTYATAANFTALTDVGFSNSTIIYVNGSYSA